MSASPMARQLTESKAIPTTKRVVITDASDLPAEYSSTPGGTLFSTTPGGSRIVYERSFLIKLSSSPLAKTPPGKFEVPEGLVRGAPHKSPKSYKTHPVTAKKTRSPLASETHHDDEQFPMDM